MKKSHLVWAAVAILAILAVLVLAGVIPAETLQRWIELLFSAAEPVE